MKNKVFFAIAFIASIVTCVVICKKKGKIVYGENSKQSQKKDATVDTMGKSIVLYTNLNQMKADASENISERHVAASEIIKEITADVFEDKSIDHKLDFEEIDSTLDDLLCEE